VSDYVLGEVDSPNAVQLNHVELLVEIGFPEVSTNPNACIDARYIERTSALSDRFPKGVDPLASCEVGPDLGDVHAETPKLFDGLGDPFARGADHQVISTGG
jgi:hypothetical protein